MNTILEKIVAARKKRLGEEKDAVPVKILEKKCRDIFLNHAMAQVLSGREHVKVIAEYKKASPSAGVMSSADPAETAALYAESGVAAVSVLTEKDFFKGSMHDFNNIRQKISLPLLRKDFIIEEYQILESAAAGADALLLIAAILSKKILAELSNLAKQFGIDVVIEVHTQHELDVALEIESGIIGINNRNLDTFAVDISTTEHLAHYIPTSRIIVSESGIQSVDDIKKIKDAGVNAVLIGGYFMKAHDRKACVSEIVKAGL